MVGFGLRGWSELLHPHVIVHAIRNHLDIYLEQLPTGIKKVK